MIKVFDYIFEALFSLSWSGGVGGVLPFRVSCFLFGVVNLLMSNCF